MPRTPAPAPRSAPSASVSSPDMSLAADLLAWYDRHRRVLPWRALPGETSDPYRVWLSEIMLQQTTVKAVVPYYRAFLARWASVTALAAAPIEQVMQAWAGLGYYSRARNLHACAVAVVAHHDGRFPDTEAGLRALPGIGTYTAAAIAAIAFGRRAVVVDGNVERVMARLHAVETAFPRAKSEVPPLMAAVTPDRRAGDFAQAMMDLGATICTPKAPACAICPLLNHCIAARTNRQRDLPRRERKTKVVVRHGVSYVVTRDDGAVLVRTRPSTGLLGGMTEVPGSTWTEVDPTVSPAAPTPLRGRYAGRVSHTFTHFTLLLDVVALSDNDADAPMRTGCRWVDRPLLKQEALPTLMQNVLAIASATAPAALPIRRGRTLGSRTRRTN